jgi:small subunit ribosomal protein S4e
MAKKHLFSLNAPANWPIKRKEHIWVTRPNPGSHPLNRCLSLSLLIKEILGYAKTAREVRNILNNGEILINNKVIKEPKFSVGVFDIIKIKSKNETFLLLINSKNKYETKKISGKESNLKLCKVINKKTLKKGLIQVNLFDGRNIIVDKDSYKTGDTIILDLEKNKINSHLKLEKNSIVYLIGGKYIGNIGKVEDIVSKKGLQKSKILLKIDDKNIETLKEYAFVVDKSMMVQNE